MHVRMTTTTTTKSWHLFVDLLVTTSKNLFSPNMVGPSPTIKSVNEPRPGSSNRFYYYRNIKSSICKKFSPSRQRLQEEVYFLLLSLSSFLGKIQYVYTCSSIKKRLDILNPTTTQTKGMALYCITHDTNDILMKVRRKKKNKAIGKNNNKMKNKYWDACTKQAREERQGERKRERTITAASSMWTEGEGFRFVLIFVGIWGRWGGNLITNFFLTS